MQILKFFKKIFLFKRIDVDTILKTNRSFIIRIKFKSKLKNMIIFFIFMFKLKKINKNFDTKNKKKRN